MFEFGHNPGIPHIQNRLTGAFLSYELSEKQRGHSLVTEEPYKGNLHVLVLGEPPGNRCFYPELGRQLRCAPLPPTSLVVQRHLTLLLPGKHHAA